MNALTPRWFVVLTSIALNLPLCLVAAEVYDFNTPTIDGVNDIGEWDNSGKGSVDFFANLLNGQTAPGTLFAANDESNLYLAVSFAAIAPGFDPPRGVVFEFDSDLDGNFTEEGEDAILFNAQSNSFHDNIRVGNSGPFDTSVGGTTDGNGAFSEAADTTVYELWHPLNSGDVNDFSLSVGDLIGVRMLLRMCDSTGCADTYLTTNIRIVPEPTTLALAGIGLAGVACSRRRRL